MSDGRDVPPHWPKGVRRLSWIDDAKMGIDAKNRLHWDGQPVEIRQRLKLTTSQGVGAWLLVGATVIGAVAAAAQAVAAWRH